MKTYIRLIPPFLVRYFARPYVAGDSLAAAMNTAADLFTRRGLLTSLDLLAEGIETQAAVQANIDTYLAMVDAVVTDKRLTVPGSRPTLSLKPSSYTTQPLERGGDGAGARQAVERICAAARDRGVGVTIDMEGAA